MTERKLKFNGIDLEIDLLKVVSVDVEKKLLYIEEIKDGKYRLTFSKSLIEDISKVSDIEIIRKD